MNALFDRIRETLAPKGAEATESHGVLVVQIAPAEVLPVATLLRDRFRFDMFSDVTAVDWLGQEPRFEVVWHFYSTMHKLRVRMKARVGQAAPVVASLTGLYGSAHFMERECHEMYGIDFAGNADLRPILLYEGFKGHPLRKDYPKELEQPLVPYREGFAAPGGE
jgi:NADH-quinone oxidoreductase subunit C